MNDPDPYDVAHQACSRLRNRAIAKISIQNFEVTAFDRSTVPALLELRIRETFTGEIEGDGIVRVLQVVRDGNCASFVGLLRFRGKLGGRQGTCVLQGPGTVQNGRIEGTWLVVPGSGTGELTGLRGEAEFEGEFGRGSEGMLDYWFE